MNFDLKCPVCVAVVQAPASLLGKQTQCPHCKSHLKLEGTPTSAELTVVNSNVDHHATAILSPSSLHVIYQHESEVFTVDPRTHHVESPSRAIELFRTQRESGSASRFVSRWVLALIGSIVGCVSGFALLWIDVHFSKDQTRLGFVGACLCLTSFVSGTISAFRCIVDSLGAVAARKETPRMEHPFETLKTFFAAIDWELWDRAYNCLSDTAKSLADVPTPLHGQFSRRMPRPEFTSVHSFESFWKSIPDKWNPVFAEATMSLPEPGVAVMNLPIDFRRTDIPAPSETILCRFVAVQRDKWWFLANGFFWPLSDYVAQNGLVPCRLCKRNIGTATYDHNGGLCPACNKGSRG